MTIVTVELPDVLYQRAEEQAAGRGASVAALVQEDLEEYLDELEPLSESRRVMLQRLQEARAEMEKAGEKFLTWEELRGRGG
jgi:predicted DNA-binding protein